MQPLGPTISATRVGQHPNPSVSDLHGPTWPTRMIGKARHSELIADGNALCAIENHCSVEERYARAPYGVILRTDHDKTWYAWDYRWGRNIDCGAPLVSMVAYECGAIACQRRSPRTAANCDERRRQP